MSLSGAPVLVAEELSPEPVFIAGGKTNHYASTTKITKFTKEGRKLRLIFVLFVSFVVHK